MRPPAQLLTSLARTRARVFQGTAPQPHGQPSVRTGAKYLRKTLVGPAMLAYYPPKMGMGPVTKALYGKGGLLQGTTWKAPDGSIRSSAVSAMELARLKSVEKMKKLGRGPPPKGKGRRAMMKAKGGAKKR